MPSSIFFACVISVLITPMVKADVSNQDVKVESESRGMTEDGADVMYSSSRRKRSDDLGGAGAALTMLSEKLNQLEAALQATNNKMESTNNKMAADLQATNNKMAADLQATNSKMAADLQATNQKIETRGSTFIRWGRTTCPANTHLVYSGISGGKYYRDSGSGTNRLCLTKSPQFDNLPASGALGRIYGGEYYDVAGLHGHDVPCAVCRTPLSTTITVPGTLTCPQGWTTQFKGHLMSTTYTYNTATEFVCGDQSPQGTGNDAKQYGNLFEYTYTVCGSLPCPPYQNNRVVTCVVCSL